MKILVTGATGFIGSHLAERLVREGHEVTALVRSGGDITLLDSLGVALARGDLGDYPTLEAAVRGQEVVYHLAAAVSQSAPSRAVYRATNALGTGQLVRAVVAGGVRHLVYCSSVAVHGTPATCPADERAPLRPDYFTYRMKIEGERLVRKACLEEELSAAIARPTSVYGPRGVRWRKLFSDIARNRFTMLGDGTTRYHITYVDDVVEGLICCGGQRGAKGEPTIIGAGEAVTIGAFVGTIAEECGVALNSRRLSALPLRPVSSFLKLLSRSLGVETRITSRIDLFTVDRAYDISRAKRELGYLPRVSLREGVRQTVEWFRKNNYL